MLVIRIMILLMLGLTASSAVLAEEDQGYKLGEGISLADGKLLLGGYASVRMRALEKQKSRGDIGDISLLANWKATPRLSAFTELEVERPLTLDENGLNSDDSEFEIERLYADFAATDRLNLRGGKFLTPFGRWNLVHAEPLVWTTSRPLTTDSPFPREAIGAAALGTFFVADQDLDYIVYGDWSQALDPHKEDDALEGAEFEDLPSSNFDNGLGLQLRYHFLADSAELGFSFLNAEYRDFEHRKTLLGLDFLWSRAGYEISSEAVYRYAGGSGERAEWGAYLQLVAPLFDKLYAVGRYEAFAAASNSTDAAYIGVFGLAYKPLSGLVFKLEYRVEHAADAFAPAGALGSIAVLF